MSTTNKYLYPSDPNNPPMLNNGRLMFWNGVDWDDSGISVSSISPTIYGADTTGGSSSVTAFKNAIAALHPGDTLIIPTGTYLFNRTSSADTILFPGNINIICEKGVQFNYNYFYAPLFAFVKVDNVNANWNYAVFNYTDAFGTGNPLTYIDLLGYGRPIPFYEWAAHISLVGCNRVRNSNVRTSYVTAPQNNCIHIRGNPDGTLTYGNDVENIYADGVCCGLLFGEQANFDHNGLYCDNYDGYTSSTIYGPGHLVYMIDGTGTPNTQQASANGFIRNIIDNGNPLQAYTVGAHTLSLKWGTGIKVSNIISKRPEGVCNVRDLVDCDIDVNWNDSTSTTDATAGAFYFSDTQHVNNNNNRFTGKLKQDSGRDFSLFNMTGLSSSGQSNNNFIDLKITRNPASGNSTAAVELQLNASKINIEYINLSGTIGKLICSVINGSWKNKVKIDANGDVQGRYVQFSGSTPTKNRVLISPEYSAVIDVNEYVFSNNNTVIFEQAKYCSRETTSASTVNPVFTIQLASAGTYLVSLMLRSSANDMAISGLYSVAWDGFTTAFTSAVLIGAQITKGASPPAFTVSVNNAGLITVTSTAASNTWVFDYGYSMISGI